MIARPEKMSHNQFGLHSLQRARLLILGEYMFRRKLASVHHLPLSIHLDLLLSAHSSSM